MPDLNYYPETHFEGKFSIVNPVDPISQPVCYFGPFHYKLEPMEKLKTRLWSWQTRENAKLDTPFGFVYKQTNTGGRTRVLPIRAKGSMSYIKSCLAIAIAQLTDTTPAGMSRSNLEDLFTFTEVLWNCLTDSIARGIKKTFVIKHKVGDETRYLPITVEMHIAEEDFVRFSLSYTKQGDKLPKMIFFTLGTKKGKFAWNGILEWWAGRQNNEDS